MKKFYHIHFDLGISPSATCWNSGILSNGEMGEMHCMTILRHRAGLECINFQPKFEKTIAEEGQVLTQSKFIEKYSACFNLTDLQFEEILGISILSRRLPKLDNSGFLIYRRGTMGEISSEDLKHLFPEELKIARIAFTSVERGEIGLDDFLDHEEVAAIYVPDQF